MKERILLHLFDLARFAEAYEAPLEATQPGIAEAAQIRVAHFMESMRPLIRNGQVEERTSHVKGQRSRRKVYFLTPAGRQEAARLRNALLREEVPLRDIAGSVRSIPLVKVYQEERRGTTLLQLVREANASGAIAHVTEVEVAPPADFTQEIPAVGRFYGRTRELAEVLRDLEVSPIVAVTGFAGIGKTSLGAKVCEALREKRPLFWRRIRPWDTPSDLAARLAAFLKAQGRASLHNLLSLSGARELSQVEDRLADDLAGLPPLIVFDDVQEASPEAEALLTLLTRVLQSQRGANGLFLSRAGLRFISQREVVLEGSGAEVALGGLDRKSSAALLSDAGVPTRLIKPFAEASGGNPLFLQLLARTPHQEGLEQGWSTVATYIAEQIEPFLDAAEKDCLEAGSLYDVPVPGPALLIEGRARAATLVALRRKGLLGQVGDRRYIVHDALKDFFRKSMAAERKAALSSKLVRWLLETGEEVARRGAPQAAVGYLGNAATLEPDGSRGAAILARRGQMRLFMLHYDAAIQDFHAALAETEGPLEKARLHFWIASALEWEVLSLEAADREIDEGLALLPPGPTPERVLLLTRRSDIAVWRADFERAQAAAREAAEIAESIAVVDELRARVFLTRARARLYAGEPFDFGATEEDLHGAAEAATKAHNEWQLSVCTVDLASTLLRAGRVEEALRTHDRAEGPMRLSGQASNWLEFLAEKARLLAEYPGALDEAEGLLREKMRLAKEQGYRWHFLLGYREMARLYRHRGRHEEARESLGYFLETTEEGDLYRLTTSWWTGGRLHDLSLMARLCARCGDAASGERFLREAEDLARKGPPTASAFELAWSQASLHAARGQTAKAETEYRRALSLPIPFYLQRMSHPEERRAECMLEFGRWLADRGEIGPAKRVLGDALEVFSRRGLREFEGVVREVLSSLQG